MYPRHAGKRAQGILADTPVLAIVGPRQAGKTTLARSIGASRRYVNLDDAAYRRAALEDPVGLVRDVDGAIIDEIQRAPELMLAVKASVDADRRPGRFIITGSANLLTLHSVQDSLAGRIEMLPLLPLSQDEIADEGPAHFLDRLFAGDRFTGATRTSDLVARVLAGGFPDAIARRTQARRQDWLVAYATAIAAHDVAEIASIERAATLPRLLRLVAARNGQLQNVTELASQVGIDRKTALRYLELVEKLFVVRTLSAWSTNAAKRLVKAPKLHFVDSGLAAALTRVTRERLQADRRPFGPLLESFVLSELDKQNTWSDGRYDFSHFRDKDGAEVDIVVESHDGGIAGIEVKAAASVSSGDFTGLSRLAAAAGDRFVGGVVLYDGTSSLPFGERKRAVPISALWSADDH